MEESVLTAIIAGSAALCGATIPQIFTLITQNNEHKRVSRKEYQLNKVKAYTNLSGVIIDFFYQNTEQTQNWEAKIQKTSSQLQQVLEKEGIWLDDEEIKAVKDIQRELGKWIINEMEKKQRLPLTEIEPGALADKIDQLHNICRQKIRKAYFQ
ncbi:hypothetical protein V7158_15025 [Priestia megaterium]|uniref:hypothetical protein n=1 Tax=Priestia megaterium TaxID=1404 RepID=UPI002FFF7E10